MASDHYLVRSTIRLKLKRAPVKRYEKNKFDVEELRDVDICIRFSLQLRNRFQVLEIDEPNNKEEEENVERITEAMEEVYVKKATEALEYKKKKSKPKSLGFNIPKKDH